MDKDYTIHRLTRHFNPSTNSIISVPCKDWRVLGRMVDKDVILRRLVILEEYVIDLRQARDEIPLEGFWMIKFSVAMSN